MGHVEEMFPEASMDSPVCSAQLRCLACAALQCLKGARVLQLDQVQDSGPLQAKIAAFFGPCMGDTLLARGFLSACEDEIFLQLELQRSQHDLLSQATTGESLPRSRELLERHAQGRVQGLFVEVPCAMGPCPCAGLIGTDLAELKMMKAECAGRWPEMARLFAALAGVLAGTRD